MVVVESGGWSVRVDLILQAHVLKQVGHALLVVYASDTLHEQGANVHGFDFVALHLLHVVGHRVCDHHLVDQGVLDESRRFGGQHAVGGQHVDLVGAAFV